VNQLTRVCKQTRKLIQHLKGSPVYTIEQCYITETCPLWPRLPPTSPPTLSTKRYQARSIHSVIPTSFRNRLLNPYTSLASQLTESLENNFISR